jgi:hypothetical protein
MLALAAGCSGPPHRVDTPAGVEVLRLADQICGITRVEVAVEGLWVHFNAEAHVAVEVRPSKAFYSVEKGVVSGAKARHDAVLIGFKDSEAFVSQVRDLRDHTYISAHASDNSCVLIVVNSGDQRGLLVTARRFIPAEF